MEFKIECPWCNQHYSVDESFVGQTVECSVCEKEFTVRKPIVSAPEQQSRFTLSQHYPKPEYMNQQQWQMTGYGVQKPIIPQQQVVYIQVPSKAKNRGIYVMLGVFLGTLGVHNFYAGHIARGVAHLCLGLWFFLGFLVKLSRAEDAIDVSFAFMILLIVFLVNSVWAIFEIITIKNDGKGIPME